MEKKKSKPNKLVWLISAACLTFSSGAWANATGEQVVAGQAGFTRNGSDLIITQGSQRVIINWQDFSNNYGELTKFIQPNSSAAALNRVISGNLSSLLGDLQANGQIYLINPNGIVVGADANINTQSFIASTLDVANAEFMNGGDLNFVGDSEASVTNLGSIDADGGNVFLIAKHVDNQGMINADGHVGLAGGNDVLLKASGDDRLAVRVTDKDGRVEQKGLIEATKIELRTAGNNPYALAINHEGISRATSAVNKEGRIILFAEGGTTKVDGTLDASAPESGNGGFIETSGTHVKIADTVKIDTSSKNGETGEWLIDPNDFTIAATGGDMTAATLATQLNSNNVTIETATQGTAGGNGDIFVNEDTTWTSNNSLTLTAERNIEVNNAITNTGTGDLNLNALDGSITTSTAAITLGGGNATLTTTEDVSNNTSGDRNITIGSGGISAANTNVTLNSADDVIVDGAINAASVTATAGDGKKTSGPGEQGERGGEITINETLASTLGNIQLTAGHGGEGSGVILQSALGLGGVGGSINLNAALDSAQDIRLTAGSGGLGGNYRALVNGGVGGSGGDIVASASATAGRDLLLFAGNGGTGGVGGEALPFSVLVAPGRGGNGGDGGNVILNATMIAGQTAQLSSGNGGVGGVGGEGAYSVSTGYESGGGDGGNGGTGGKITFNAPLVTDQGIQLTAGDGGIAGFGGSGALIGFTGAAGADGEMNGSQIDATAANGSITIDGFINPDAGSSVSLLAGTATGQLLTFTTPQDFSLTGTGSLNLRGYGFSSANNFNTEDGDININSGDGALNLTGSVTATNGDVSLTSGGNLSASQIITGNNINLTATGTDSAIGSAVQAIQTNVSGIITASANNGTGGIFLSNQGDFNLNGATINAGTGNAELTAVNGNLTTGTTAFNFTGANLTLATTEDVSNTTAGDRNITIGSGGINAASTAVTFNSADDVVLNGAVQIDMANSQITGERLMTSAAVGSLGNSTDSLSTSVDRLNLQGTDFYLTNNKAVAIDGVSASGAFLLDNGANDITVDGQISAQGTGDAIRLAGQKFINNAGASALNAASGRWIVWSETPVNNTFGGLQSGNDAVWSTSFNAGAPTLAETGNRFAFSIAKPTGIAIVKADDQSKVYGDTFSGFTFSSYAADSGSSYGDAFTDTGSGSVTLTGAPVLASLGAINTATRTGGNGGGADYDITVDLTGVTASGFTLQGMDGLLTINQRDITVAADGFNLTYGDSAQALTFNATNLASFDTNASAFTGALTRTMGANSTSGNEVVGTYGITQGSLVANENYNLTGFTGNNYSIAQKSLTATATGQNKVYDATTNATVTFIDDGISGDVLSLSGTASFLDKNVANGKTINVTGINLSGTDASNYTLTNTTDTTTANITQASLSVTANDINRVYSGTAFNGGTVSFSGFVGGETKNDLGGTEVFGGSSQGAVNAGNYIITASGLTSNNYDITFIDGQLVIDPTALNVIAKNDSKVFDGIAYSGGNGVDYTGFVSGETAAVLTGTVNYSGNSQGATNPGNYVITPGGLTSNNYAITFVNGGLTINAATIGGSGNSGSGSNGGGSNTPAGTFNNFQSQTNNNVIPPSTGSNNNSFTPPPSFSFNSQGGNNFGNNSPFPLRLGFNGMPPSFSHSSSFKGDGGNKDDE